MSNGRVDKPDYRLPEQMTLFGVDEAITDQEHLSADEVRKRSEEGLANLSALRVKEDILIEGEDGKAIVTGQREAEPRWMEIYRRLREGGWDWRVAVYIAWRAMPKKYRWPDTQEELAKKCLGLTSDRAIATWRKKNSAIDETISMLQGAIIFDALPDAMQAMVDVATTANYKGHQDRKLLFEMSGVYTPSSKLTAEMIKKLGKGNMDASDLSDDELRDIASSASQELERRTHEEPDEEENE